MIKMIMKVEINDLDLDFKYLFITVSKESKAIFSFTHRLSINRPTKRGKENSRSDGHCQCKKEIEDHLLACQ
jgi:hypothetical protein